VVQGLGKCVLLAVTSISIAEMVLVLSAFILNLKVVTYIALVWYGALLVFVPLDFALLAK
jgi:hypothetical protein